MSINTHSLDLERDSSQFAFKTDNASLSITGDFTFEAYVKPETVGILQYFTCKNDNTGAQRAYEIVMDTNNLPMVTYYSHVSFGDGLWTRTTSNVALSAGSWAHMAVTVDVSVPTITWYLNGTVVASTVNNATALSIADSSADFVIGAGLSGGTKISTYDGLIDDIRLWNDIRTAQEISDNRSIELAGTEANLVGYWKLNNDYSDETANNNDLTSSGTPSFSSDIFFTGVDTGWEEIQPAGDANKEWTAVASDEDSSFLIAGSGNDVGRLYTSSNGGTSWTERQPAGDVNSNWYALIANSDGSKLVAGENSGRLYTSIDSGTNWTERQPAGNVNGGWAKSDCGTNGNFIIVGNSSSGRLYTSTDSGTNWTERQPAGDVDRNWYGVACDADGSNLIVASQSTSSGEGRVYISTDSGANWKEAAPASALDTWWIRGAISNDGSIILACIYNNNIGRIYRSTDFGSNWTELTPAGSVLRGWAAADMDYNGLTVIVGSFISNPTGTNTGRMYKRAFSAITSSVSDETKPVIHSI